MTLSEKGKSNEAPTGDLLAELPETCGAGATHGAGLAVDDEVDVVVRSHLARGAPVEEERHRGRLGALAEELLGADPRRLAAVEAIRAGRGTGERGTGARSSRLCSIYIPR